MLAGSQRGCQVFYSLKRVGDASKNAPFTGKQYLVEAVVGAGDDDAIPKTAADSIHQTGQAALARVHHQHAPLCQRGIAGTVEGLAAQFRRLPIAIKTIHQQCVEKPPPPLYKLPAIHAEHFQPAIVFGYAKPVAKSDDLGTDLCDADGSMRQIAITEFRDGPAAQSNNAEMFRLSVEGEKTHHRPRVTEHEIVRCVRAHLALHSRRLIKVEN